MTRESAALVNARWFLNAVAEEVGPMRDLIVAQLQAWKYVVDREAIGDVKLLAGELLANAVKHGKTDMITVVLCGVVDQVVLCVMDGSNVLPRSRPAGPDRESGRGMGLIEELSSSNGAYLTAGGKAVWATVDLMRVPTLAATPVPDHEAERAALLARVRDAAPHVRIGNFATVT